MNIHYLSRLWLVFVHPNTNGHDFTMICLYTSKTCMISCVKSLFWLFESLSPWCYRLQARGTGRAAERRRVQAHLSVQFDGDFRGESLCQIVPSYLFIWFLPVHNILGMYCFFGLIWRMICSKVFIYMCTFFSTPNGLILGLKWCTTEHIIVKPWAPHSPHLETNG